MEPHQHDEKCREMFAMLSRYIDLDLPMETCREIEAHMAGCGPCIEFAESLRKTVELCRKYKPKELPEPLGEEAKAKLREAYETMLAARSGTGGRE